MTETWCNPNVSAEDRLASAIAEVRRLRYERAHMRRTIRHYIERVEDGDRFSALIDLVEA